MLLLAYTEKNQRENDENFWSVYFIAPFTENDNAFIIDNHSADATFHYIVTSNEQEVLTGDISVAKDDHALIDPEEIDRTFPITITVTQDTKKKFIEKK
jgi:hypothetical protein